MHEVIIGTLFTIAALEAIFFIVFLAGRSNGFKWAFFFILSGVTTALISRAGEYLHLWHVEPIKYGYFLGCVFVFSFALAIYSVIKHNK